MHLMGENPRRASCTHAGFQPIVGSRAVRPYRCTSPEARRFACKPGVRVPPSTRRIHRIPFFAVHLMGEETMSSFLCSLQNQLTGCPCAAHPYRCTSPEARRFACKPGVRVPPPTRLIRRIPFFAMHLMGDETMSSFLCSLQNQLTGCPRAAHPQRCTSPEPRRFARSPLIRVPRTGGKPRRPPPTRPSPCKIFLSPPKPLANPRPMGYT